MKNGARLAGAIIIGVLTYAFSYWIPYTVLLPLELNGLAQLLALLTGALAGRFIYTRTNPNGQGGGRMRAALRDALVFGGIGFALGFFGPMLLGGGNQGPLLGIFITGPLGFVVGLGRGFLRGAGAASSG